MSNTKITQLPIAVGVDGQPYMEVAVNTAATGQPAVWVSKRCTLQQVANLFANQLPAAIEYIIDDGGADITTGIKGYLEMPFAGTITSVSLLADATGSAEIDIWRCTYAAFDPPTTPTSANSICGGNYPAIVAGTKFRDATLTSWTVSFDQGDVLAYNVRSNSGLMRLTVSLEASRTVV